MKQKTLVVIVHGYEGNTYDSWKPWLSRELKKRGYMVKIPKMPNPEHPQANAWVKAISQAIDDQNGSTILIGHSLGGNAIVRAAEKKGTNVYIKALITIGGAMLPKKDYAKSLSTFIKKPLNYEIVKKYVKHVYVIYSKDDTAVDMGSAKLLKKNLGAELILENSKGHYSSRDKIYKIPIILKLLSDI